MLSKSGCKLRQQRFIRRFSAEKLDLCFISNSKNLKYFTNLNLPPELSGYAIWEPKRLLLVNSFQQDTVYADSVHLFNARDQGGLHNQRFNYAAQALAKTLKATKFSAIKSIGIELNQLSAQAYEVIKARFPKAIIKDISEIIRQLRRAKDDDELALIKKSIAVNEAAYYAAEKSITPGKTELDIYHSMYTAVTQVVGTSISLDGDFGCGERCHIGGPPTTRKLRTGELFILDLFPPIYGYRSDMCRTFAVGKPSSIQIETYNTVKQALYNAAKLIRPGVPCREIVAFLDQTLNAQKIGGGSFWHHAGHGVGLDPHESPRITKESPDNFESGDVFSMEPGLYHKSLRGGIRLEDVYQVTKTGVKRLSHFPFQL